MTTVDLYKKHKSGEVSREKFLYEVRRDAMLPFITNLTSYSDAVQILKNKGIIKEESFPEEDPYNQGVAANKAHKNYTDNPYSKYYEPEKYAEWTDGWIDQEGVKQAEHDADVFDREGGIAEEEYNPEGAWQEGYDAFENGQHQEENPYEGDTTEHKNWDMGYEKAQHDGPGLNEDPASDDVEKAIRDKKLDPKLVQKAAQDAEKGNPNALAILMATSGLMKEGKELTLDTVNPYEYRKGMNWELGYATLPAPGWDENAPDEEAFIKAGKKVLKNLSSDPNYYTTLISNKGEKPKKVKEVKVEEDGMAKIKGVEKVTANVQTSLGKSEKGKKNPEGVKEMKGTKKTFSKIKLMKESDLNAALDKNLRKLFK